jgi:hypothetical protein
MPNELWCKVCSKAVSATVTRGAASAVVPLAGMLGAAVPKLFGRRRRSGVFSMLLQGALGAGTAYLASRYLVPQLQRAVCGTCGAKATAAPAAA